MNEVVVVVLNTVLAEMILQILSKPMDLILGLAKRVTVVVVVLLAFLGLE